MEVTGLVTAWRLLLSLGCFLASSVPARGDERAGARRAHVVALDVGHGPSAPGATSARGVPELAFNRRLAAELREAIESSGLGRAYLIEDTGDLGGAAGLRRRSALAAKVGASLLVSIHHDSVQERHLHPWTIRPGKEGRFGDTYSGYSIFYAKGAPEAGRCLRLAAMLGDELRAQGLHPSLHHAEDIPGERRELVDARRGIYAAEFAVLASSTIPAVLLEAGIIVNRDEELALSRREYRARICRALVRAVSRFLAEAPGARGPERGRPPGP